MAKTKRLTRSTRPIGIYLPAPVAIVLVSLSILVVALLYQATKNPNTPSISLGAMGHQIVDGKAVKRTDVPVQSLKAFLHEKAANEGCPSDKSAYEHVAAVTKDENQALLKYGCGAADSPMYIVKKNGVWTSVSPTNQFDTFGIPSCEHLNEHAISKEVAPVCVNGLAVGGGDLTYSVHE